MRDFAQQLRSICGKWRINENMRNMNMFYIYQLPLPRLTKNDKAFISIVERAARLICTTPEFDDLAQEAWNKPVYTLQSESNSNLIVLGVKSINTFQPLQTL